MHINWISWFNRTGYVNKSAYCKTGDFHSSGYGFSIPRTALIAKSLFFLKKANRPVSLLSKIVLYRHRPLVSIFPQSRRVRYRHRLVKSRGINNLKRDWIVYMQLEGRNQRRESMLHPQTRHLASYFSKTGVNSCAYSFNSGEFHTNWKTFYNHLHSNWSMLCYRLLSLKKAARPSRTSRPVGWKVTTY